MFMLLAAAANDDDYLFFIKCLLDVYSRDSVYLWLLDCMFEGKGVCCLRTTLVYVMFHNIVLFCCRIMTSGFVDLFDDNDEQPSAHFHLHGPERRKSQVGELPPRIAVSPAMMIEMLTGLYYIM